MAYAFQDYDNLYLVMDLLTGGDLRYHIGKVRKFSEDQSRFFLGCVILGLEYIHSKNIIHRDIKPENLVLDDKGYLRITDFGIAKEVKGDNHKETSGTPGYMAPEVLCGKNHSFPVDFFAIGVMAYEFMMGERPYQGRSRKEIKQQILKSQVRITEDDLPKGWSKQSADFANKLLRRKDVNRLGCKYGIKELKEHPWFYKFDWANLMNKTMFSPFFPPLEGNYNKRYCEEKERISPETEERYKLYVESQNYENCFVEYTFFGEYNPCTSHSNEQYNISTNNSTNNINLTLKNFKKANKTIKILKKNKTTIFSNKKSNTNNNTNSNSVNLLNFNNNEETFLRSNSNPKRKLSFVNQINVNNHNNPAIFQQPIKKLQGSQSCKILQVNFSMLNNSQGFYNLKNYTNKRKYFLPFLNIVNGKIINENNSLKQNCNGNICNRKFNSLKKNKIIYSMSPNSQRSQGVGSMKRFFE